MEALSPDVVLMTYTLAATPEGEALIMEVQDEHVAPVVILSRKADRLSRKRLNPYGVLVVPASVDQWRNTLRVAVRNFRSRADLLQKRDLLDALLHHAREGFILLNASGMVLEVNDAYCGMVGVDREVLVGRSIVDLDEGESQEPFLETLARCGEEGRVSSRRRHRVPEGGTVDLLVDATAVETREGILYSLFCRDITEQLEREALMRLQTSALASAANVVVITDTDGVILWVNRAFTRVTGYTLEEAAGEKPGDLLQSGMQDPSFYKDLWARISRGEVWNGEIQNRSKDGNLFTEDMTITPLFDASGAITHYIAIKQDITEQKRLERMLQRVQRLESIGTLASGVAHDLNNVLSPVIMSADLLAMKLKDPEQLELVSMMKEGVMRGAEVIRQLLSFARGSEAARGPVEVESLLKEICKVMRETFPKNIDIQMQFKQRLPEVSGDPNQLHQVFTNLMINARDAMPEGGILTVEAAPCTVSDAWARAHPPAHAGDYVRVRVRDTGTGMSDAVRERIFDPFFSTKAAGKGTGLGLSTSLGILHSHEGFLEIKSVEGEGSVFDAYVPAAVAENATSIPEPKKMPPTGNSERILVVDDEEAVRFMLNGTLSALRYRVELVEDGLAALRRLEEDGEGYDLIVLDMMMPRMDGAAFLEKARDRLDPPPVLVISGMVERDQLEATGLDLSTCFLAKPFTIDELASKIREVLDSAGGGRKGRE